MLEFIWYQNKVPRPKLPDGRDRYFDGPWGRSYFIAIEDNKLKGLARIVAQDDDHVEVEWFESYERTWHDVDFPTKILKSEIRIIEKHA